MAYDFDGTDDYLSITSALPSARPITMAAWVNSDTLAAQKCIMSVVHSADADGWRLLTNATTGEIRAETFGSLGEVKAESTSGIGTGAWHHACGVFVSQTSRWAYLDGAGVQNTTDSGTVSVNRTVVGAMIQGGSTQKFWDGRIAEAALWSVELNSAEIAALAKGMCPLLIRPTAIVVYLPLVRTTQDLRGTAWTVNSAPAVAVHPRVYYPRSHQYLGKGGAAPPPAADPTPQSLLLLGVGS